MIRTTGLALLGAATLGAPAAAQDYIRADCRRAVSTPALRFDDAAHAAWYRRFWTGDCSGLVFCQSGEPTWNAVVGQAVRKSAPAGRAGITRRACRLGRVIGHEWARDNAVRRIDTADLTSFVEAVQAAANIDQGLAAVERSARSRLGGE